ncbi:hypothetical protein GCM10007061_04110 [Kocuria marina]|nr:hypothetical protein GCM10007061_04110 [Kocuria marina]
MIRGPRRVPREPESQGGRNPTQLLVDSSSAAVREDGHGLREGQSGLKLACREFHECRGG